MRHLLLFNLIIFMVISCKDKLTTEENSFKVLLPDTSKTNRPNTEFGFYKDLAKRVGLHPIEEGTDSFELRLWTSSMINPNVLIILRYTDSSTSAQKFLHYSDPDSIVESLRIHNVDSVRYLLSELRQFSFPEMISQNEIANFNDVISDGVSYHLEISTSRYYKYINYHCPEYYAFQEPNNKTFLDLIKLLDKYISFHSPICKSR